MKKLLTLIAAAFLTSLTNGQPAWAQAEFLISASLPASTQLNITPSKWADADANGIAEFVSVQEGVTELVFANLELVEDDQGQPLGIFLPGDGIFWGLDIGGDAAGLPDITIDYQNEANPNAPNGGLDKKGTITSFKVTGGPGPEDQVTTLIPNKAGSLGDLPFNYDADTDLANGFLRLFLGISDGSDNAPASSEPFTPGDAPGLYSGTLTISITSNP